MRSQILNTPESKRIPELDGIRGLAILHVLLYHYVAVAIPEDAGAGLGTLRQILSNGWSGVDLFFVLSGFLIAGILIDNRHASNYFKVFYFRRVNRIFPLYYFFLSLFILLQWFGPQLGWLSKNLFTNPFPIAPYFIHLQNFSMALKGTFGNEFLAMTWSLAIEEHFYLFLPLLIHRSRPDRLPLLFLFLIALTLALRTMVGQGSYMGFVLTPWRLDALFLGAFLALMMRKPQTLSWLKTKLAWIKGLFLGLLAFLLYSTLTEELGSLDHLFTFGVFYTLLIFLTLMEKDALLARIFRNPALKNLGLIAYGLYLFHQLVNGLLHDLLLKSAPSFESAATISITLLSLFLTYALAQTTFQLFEKRFIALGHTFRYEEESTYKHSIRSNQNRTTARHPILGG
jgi:peptidoglycan/LPS O-acetylase OafA/YrhL